MQPFSVAALGTEVCELHVVEKMMPLENWRCNFISRTLEVPHTKAHKVINLKKVCTNIDACPNGNNM